MTKNEKRRLMALVKKFRKESAKNEAWIKKNFHRCGHGTTPDALGDEGWMEAHRRGGLSQAYMQASYDLKFLLQELEL